METSVVRRCRRTSAADPSCIASVFHLPVREASLKLGVSPHTLKELYMEFCGTDKDAQWPYIKFRKIEERLAGLEQVLNFANDRDDRVQQSIRLDKNVLERAREVLRESPLLPLDDVLQRARVELLGPHAAAQHSPMAPPPSSHPSAPHMHHHALQMQHHQQQQLQHHLQQQQQQQQQQQLQLQQHSHQEQAEAHRMGMSPMQLQHMHQMQMQQMQSPMMNMYPPQAAASQAPSQSQAHQMAMQHQGSGSSPALPQDLMMGAPRDPRMLGLWVYRGQAPQQQPQQVAEHQQPTYVYAQTCPPHNVPRLKVGRSGSYTSPAGQMASPSSQLGASPYVSAPIQPSADSMIRVIPSATPSLAAMSSASATPGTLTPASHESQHVPSWYGSMPPQMQASQAHGWTLDQSRSAFVSQPSASIPSSVNSSASVSAPSVPQQLYSQQQQHYLPPSSNRAPDNAMMVSKDKARPTRARMSIHSLLNAEDVDMS